MSAEFPSFRRVSSTTSAMMESYCSDCGLFIAASPLERVILVMEGLHQCQAPFRDLSRQKVEELMQALSSREEQLAAWIRASERNTRWFATDPLSAIRAANLGIDDHVLEQLELITLSIARKLRQAN